MPARTLGVSPKLLAPLVTALSAIVVSWITTGDLSRPELAALAVAVIGAVAAYLAPPGDVQAPPLVHGMLGESEERDPDAEPDEPELR